MRSRLPRISAPERGFTLLEVTVSVALLMLVTAAMLASFATMQRTAARESSRSEAADQVRLTMERMSKEIRQAVDIYPTSTVDYLEMDTYVEGTVQHVIYDARVDNILTRTIDGSTITLLERLDVTAVWTYSPDVTDPSVINVSLIAKPEKFKHDVATIELESEVQLRNRTGEN